MKQDYLREFYEGHCDEDARLTSRCGMVEFLTTMRYIETYLKPGDRVIEIGAGTGRAAWCSPPTAGTMPPCSSAALDGNS